MLSRRPWQSLAAPNLGTPGLETKKKQSGTKKTFDPVKKVILACARVDDHNSIKTRL